ncbi:hypothetical protein J6590_003107 [Homalodisca vitripennis]|nr:hypothetical protein J6590_003107 [Homalodisca vitripennis]
MSNISQGTQQWKCPAGRACTCSDIPTGPCLALLMFPYRFIELYGIVIKMRNVLTAVLYETAPVLVRGDTPEIDYNSL